MPYQELQEKMYERFTDSQTWIIVFDRQLGSCPWWSWLLHKDFKHVHLLRSFGDKTLMVNSFAHVMAIREYPNTLENMIEQELNQNCTAILSYTVHYGSYYRYSPLDILTCVSVCKRLLGIQRRLLTPKALYLELVRAGAIRIKPYTPDY